MFFNAEKCPRVYFFIAFLFPHGLVFPRKSVHRSLQRFQQKDNPPTKDLVAGNIVGRTYVVEKWNCEADPPPHWTAQRGMAAARPRRNPGWPAVAIFFAATEYFKTRAARVLERSGISHHGYLTKGRYLSSVFWSLSFHLNNRREVYSNLRFRRPMISIAGIEPKHVHTERSECEM